MRSNRWSVNNRRSLRSTHFNLGDLYYRTLNLPTFALRIRRPASRRFWVDPNTGTVLRSEMIIGGTRRLCGRGDEFSLDLATPRGHYSP